MAEGDTVIEAVVSPVSQRYVLPPLAVSSVESPLQIATSIPASMIKVEMAITNATVSFMLQDDESVATKLPLKVPADV